MDSPFKCSRCEGGFFYTEGEWVICMSCDQRYSRPSGRELKAMVNANVVADEKMSVDDFIALGPIVVNPIRTPLLEYYKQMKRFPRSEYGD